MFKPIRVAVPPALLILLALAPADASERTETDFVKACTATSNLSPVVCECSARKARAELTPGGFALLVATLEGNNTVAAQLRSKLPIDQVMKAGTFMARGPAQCVDESADPE